MTAEARGRRRAPLRYLALSLLALLLAPAVARGVPASETPALRLYLAGSSAQDSLIEGLLRLRDDLPETPALCVRGSLDIYQGIVAGTRQRAYLCQTADAVPGIPAGLTIAVFKSSGGSGDGVVPLLRQEPMPFLSFEELAGGCGASNRVLPTGDLSAFIQHVDCQTRTDRVVPDAGISDLEPALFAEDTAALRTRPLTQLVWGLPVSRNLRNALQALQGLVPAELAHDDPRRETPAAMPSLSSAQVRSIFAGTLRSWSKVYDRDGVPIPASRYLPAEAPTHRERSGTRPGAYRPHAESGGRIYVCRRIETSGTQLAYGAHYLSRGCLPDAPPFLAPDDGSSPVTGGDPRDLLDRSAPSGRVFAGRGSADVRECLDTHDDHNRWAIGMLSTENTGNYLSLEFRHIRVDGYAPTLLNAHRGLWRHVSTASLQWRRDREAGERDRVDSVLAYLARYLAQPAVLRSLNRAFRHPWGDGGYLAAGSVSPSALPGVVSARSLQQNPVAGVSYEHLGEPRNCLPPLISRGTSIELR